MNEAVVCYRLTVIRLVETTVFRLVKTTVLRLVETTVVQLVSTFSSLLAAGSIFVCVQLAVVNSEWRLPRCDRKPFSKLPYSKNICDGTPTRSKAAKKKADTAASSSQITPDGNANTAAAWIFDQITIYGEP